MAPCSTPPPAAPPLTYDPPSEARRAGLARRGARAASGSIARRRRSRSSGPGGAPRGGGAARRAMNARLFATTLDEDSPVVELGWPVHGPFVKAPLGTYFDGYLGVAQKVLDEHHPRFQAMVKTLRASRRAPAPRDRDRRLPVARPGSPHQDPAPTSRALWNEALHGAVAAARGLAGVLLQQRHRGHRGRAEARATRSPTSGSSSVRHGDVPAVQEALGTASIPFFDRDPCAQGPPGLRGLPLPVVACETSFHGRTLGVAHADAQQARPPARLPEVAGVQHVPYNAQGEPVRALVDSARASTRSSAIPGELARVVAEQRPHPEGPVRRLPRRAVPGRGRVRARPAAVLPRGRGRSATRRGALLVCDEVQAVARTGRAPRDRASGRPARRHRDGEEHGDRDHDGPGAPREVPAHAAGTATRGARAGSST